MHEEGKIDLDAPITTYLPEKYQPGPKSDWNKITVRHLLTHRSGLHNYTDQKNYDRIAKSLTVDKIVKGAMNQPLYFKPGSQFEYCNTGYTLLGVIIENVSGLSYAEFMKENIFKPAKMITTGVYTETCSKGPNAAKGYCWDDDFEHLVVDDSENLSATFSDGGIYSTVEDMAKWNTVLDGKANVLQPESLKIMKTPVLEDYGCGLYIDEDFGQPKIHHDGQIAGFNTNFCKFPKDNTYIAVLCNTTGISAERLCDEISKMLFFPKDDIPVVVPFPRDFDFEPYLGTFESDYEENEGDRYKFSLDSNRLYVKKPSGDSIELALQSNGRLLLLLDGYIPELGEEYELDNDGNIIVYDLFGNETDYLIGVFGLVERKGFHRVIACLPMLIRAFPKLHYLVVGGPGPEGDFGAVLRDQVSSLGLTEHVTFLGPVGPEGVKEALSAADVFVLATRNEGWANVLLEAMSCGLPVVATDVGGNAEVVRTQELGTIVPFGDGGALEAALGQALKREWNRSSIRAFAASNGWEHRVGILVQEFLQLHASTHPH